MKLSRFSGFLTALCLVVLLGLPVSGAIVGFRSGDEVSDGFPITPHPVWGSIPGAQWVSGVPGTGYNGVVLPNTTVPGPPTYTLVEAFYLPGTINDGWARFGADDTMGVTLYNTAYPGGLVLKAPNPVQDSACADGPIGCEPDELFSIHLTNGMLAWGLNTLHMATYQVDGGPNGDIWSATVNSTCPPNPNPVPEPATYAMLGAGLSGLALVRRRQRKT